MRRVLAYLKPYIPLVILSIAFLVGQVYTELSLPNLMSDIVDKGILLQGLHLKRETALSGPSDLRCWVSLFFPLPVQ